jgi:enoyl-CoA hydratase/carnithine racemase
MQGMGSPIHVERRGPVARITLDAPSKANALSARLLTDLLSALEECSGDAAVRAVVLTATGANFCAGADMAERLHPPPGRYPTIGEVLTAVVRARKPVVAVVQGHVRGGGMGLVAAADLAVAPAGVTFAFSEARLGVAPAVVAVPALARMERRSFERYALTGDVFDGTEAARCGLITAAVPSTAELDTWADQVLGSLLLCSPEALAAVKTLPAMVGQPWDDAIAATASLSDRLFASAAGVEGMTAFFEKRRPSWAQSWP